MIAAFQSLRQVDGTKAVSLDDSDIFVGRGIFLGVNIIVAKTIFHAFDARAFDMGCLVGIDCLSEAVQRVNLRHCCIFSSHDERVDGGSRETCSTITLGIDRNINVGVVFVGFVEFHAVEVEHTHHDVECAVGELVFGHW